MKSIIAITFFSTILLFACQKEKKIKLEDTNKLPKKITYYDLDNDSSTQDSLVIFLYKDEAKPYFDSIIRLEANGASNIIRFNYSRYANQQIIYKETPIDSTLNIWVMKFQNNTFDKEYRFYNIYNDTYTNDLINEYQLNNYQRFSSYSSTSAGSGSGLNFYSEYEPDSSNFDKMSLYLSDFTPVEKKYECTYTSKDNNTQCPILSGIYPYYELYNYPYPGLKMKLIDKCWYWNSYVEELTGTYTQYHYIFDHLDRVVFCYSDLIYRDPITLTDSTLEANKSVCRFEY